MPYSTYICLYVLISFLLGCGFSKHYHEGPSVKASQWLGSNPIGLKTLVPDPRASISKQHSWSEPYGEFIGYERTGRSRADDHTRWNIHETLPPSSSYNSAPLSVAVDWPTDRVRLGQVSAVCLGPNGNVYVLHRADHVWNSETFSPKEVYSKKDLGPIEVNTIIVYDSQLGKVIHQWGANLFYMPHGLTVDDRSNLWVTDVALHQVFKFPPGGTSGEPLIKLGTRFEPGNDDLHFCKPTSVAVLSSGDFFVADGYCNNRIIKYEADGKKIQQWGRSSTPYGDLKKGVPPPYAFSVPHGLALAEEKGILCVADRENGRIQCFSVVNGTFISQIYFPQFGERLFSVAYSPVQGGLIYAVNGPGFLRKNQVKGFVVSLSSNQLLAEFSPSQEGFSNPHDIAVSPDGKQVYVAQLDPHLIWKFTDNNSESIAPISPVGVQNIVVTKAPVPMPQPTSAIVLGMLAQNSLQSPSKQADLPNGINQPPHLLSLTMQIFIAVAAVMALTTIAVLLVFIRRKEPWCSCWMCYKRWQFRRATSDHGFKLGNLLDPHSGFEQVCTEMSDEEEIDSSANDSVRRGTDSTVPRA